MTVKELRRMLRTMGCKAAIIVYIDDFLLISPSLAEATLARAQFCAFNNVHGGHDPASH